MPGKSLSQLAYSATLGPTSTLPGTATHLAHDDPMHRTQLHCPCRPCSRAPGARVVPRQVSGCGAWIFELGTRLSCRRTARPGCSARARRPYGLLEQDVHRRGSHAAGPGGRDAPAVLRAAQRTGARKAGMVMQKLAAVPPPPPERTTAVPFALWCGMPSLAQLIVRHLIPMGFVDDPQAATLLVLDAPVGFALRALETHALAARSVIVATGSPCPEYWADLADCDPAILLAGPDLEHAIATALRHAPHGARYQLTPPVQSPLTAQERAVLRAVARGYTNAQIARIVGSRPSAWRTCSRRSMPGCSCPIAWRWPCITGAGRICSGWAGTPRRRSRRGRE